MLSTVLGTALLAASAVTAQQQYLLGLGTGDITGPIVEANQMGYASLDQNGSGLHMRMRTRAYIVAGTNTTSSADRILFLNLDIGQSDTGIRRGIIQGLQRLYNGTYSDENVAVVSTHSHAGVGGYVENLLPQLTSLGFVGESYNAIVQGTLAAVQKAHNSLAPGTLTFGKTELLDANINRSPYSYLQNPAEERARYAYDQDKDFSLLNFRDLSGQSRGFLSFFAVHGTSMYINNTLISGDNKGLAAYMFEDYVEPESAPGNATYVAGFVQGNVGDSSPNTLGSFCEAPGKDYHGQACDFKTSTCGGRTQECHSRGPGFRDDKYGFSSNQIIATKQFNAAKSLIAGSLAPVSGPVRSVHQYVNMDNYTFTSDGKALKTCPAAMGYSFAGGTTDGPGAFDFTQGNNNTSQNPLWEIVKAFVTPIPTKEQTDCHYPKPILFNTGAATFPYRWTAHVVDIQLFRIGNLVVIIAPSEFTTMAGRRIREAVRSKLIAEGHAGEDLYVALAGPSNTYAHYCATPEEYKVQRYEGASTIFGPNTLPAYTDIYAKLTPWMAASPPADQPANAPPPADQTKSSISLLTGVVMDGTPIGKKFGQVLTQPLATPYSAGQIVTVKFQGANPRNNLHLEGTYLKVERKVGEQWVQYRTDSHPSTTLTWARTGGGLSATSEVTIVWTIESSAPAGTYRISYFGDSKPLIGKITPFSGVSNVFTVA